MIQLIIEENVIQKQQKQKIIEKNNWMLEKSKGEPVAVKKIMDYSTQLELTEKFVKGSLKPYLIHF